MKRPTKTNKLYNFDSAPNEDNLVIYLFFKRVFDLTVCLLALPFAIPIMLLVMLAIRIESPDSPVFIQDRVGKGNKKFRIFKFRTLPANFETSTTHEYMQAYIAGEIGDDADESNSGNLGKPLKDDHITRTGRILRKTSLDELPQIINVLLGNMSIVGPRPNVPWEVNEYLPWHHERLDVLPGITGLAQVYGRSDIPFAELVKYDVQYIQNRSFSLDMRILWLTVKTIISGRGAG